MSDFKLTIAPPLKPSEIPSEESILAAGRSILDSIPTWKRGKTFHKNSVQTFSRSKATGDGANWHVRVSEHGPEDATFDEFWSKLGNDKAINEKECVILFLLLDFVSNILREIVSIPIDLADDPELAKLEEKGVKGRYTSVERLQEVEGGKVSWHMATSSTPGGSIPTFVAEGSIDGQIANDVPHFIKWFHKVRSAAPVSPEAVAPQEETLLDGQTTSGIAHDETLNDVVEAASGAVGPDPSGGVLPA
ncbi:hypothetical protein HWV62_9047 [Athelia sp. TMB]|nr:hypothetical protein HWV62_9047 [Athelia sp. TMB]